MVHKHFFWNLGSRPYLSRIVVYHNPGTSSDNLNNTDVYVNVDSFIIEQLRRDPRVLKNDISVPEQFRTFIEWQAENKFALQATDGYNQ